MDPRTYCEQSCAELLELRARGGSSPERLQRAVVLAYLAGQQPSTRDFERELEELVVNAVETGQPGVAAAARAILRDWQGRADGG